jgi:hypothetical protein
MRRIAHPFAAMARRDANSPFDMEHSIPVSLESFDNERLLPTTESLHSALDLEGSESGSDISDRSSAPWSPPAWRKHASGWNQRPHFLPPSNSLSRRSSPEYQSAGEGEDTLLPSNIPLPVSPPKLTPRNSVEPAPHFIPPVQEFESILSGGGHPNLKEESVPPEASSNNCECVFLIPETR